MQGKQRTYQFKDTPVNEKRENKDESKLIRLMHQTAMIVKNDISQCKGIVIRPLNTYDVSLTKAKEIMLKSLY